MLAFSERCSSWAFVEAKPCKTFVLALWSRSSRSRQATSCQILTSAIYWLPIAFALLNPPRLNPRNASCLVTCLKYFFKFRDLGAQTTQTPNFHIWRSYDHGPLEHLPRLVQPRLLFFSLPGFVDHVYLIVMVPMVKFWILCAWSLVFNGAKSVAAHGFFSLLCVKHLEVPLTRSPVTFCFATCFVLGVFPSSLLVCRWFSSVQLVSRWFFCCFKFPCSLKHAAGPVLSGLELQPPLRPPGGPVHGQRGAVPVRCRCCMGTVQTQRFVTQQAMKTAFTWELCVQRLMNSWLV